MEEEELKALRNEVLELRSRLDLISNILGRFETQTSKLLVDLSTLVSEHFQNHMKEEAQRSRSGKGLE